MATPPPAPAAGLSKPVMRWLAVFFVAGALGFFAGAAWSYMDEHSGRSGEATVLECKSGLRVQKATNTYCTGRWSADGRERTGPVYNAQPGDVGKTLSVRIHDNHASRSQIGITIAAVVGGLFLAGLAVMMLVQLRRSPPLRYR